VGIDINSADGSSRNHVDSRNRISKVYTGGIGKKKTGRRNNFQGLHGFIRGKLKVLGKKRAR
jgi:hypothetical protein